MKELLAEMEKDAVIVHILFSIICGIVLPIKLLKNRLWLLEQLPLKKSLSL